ncbi:fatty acyl-AMP ligase [Spirillospora sp. NPDC047279]|uniref:fatty acyl-AMP ligase n=1 Tax=Spirillospora sp. NPDC047279 TaxID=3155478 RepID=UPI0033D78AE3
MPASDSFVARFLAHVQESPGHAAIGFHHGPRPDDRVDALTYGELDRAARAVAARLLEFAGPGDRALLQFPAGPEFVPAFLGCLYAGVVAVPAPLFAGQGNQLDRADGIAADAGVAAVLTDAANEAAVSGWLAEAGLGEPGLADAGMGGPPTLAVSLDDRGDRAVALPAPDALAFLQYTSGSTSDPRGVMVSHGNLVHNIQHMGDTLDWGPRIPFCSWLPTFHDMGLVIGLLSPLMYGGSLAMMSPTGFVRRPLSWLRLLSDLGAQVSAAPNFAFDLCARHVTDEQLATLDLSNWRCAVNGSEPVSAATFARFTERFAPAGFRAEHFCPSYGLAEGTVYVSGSPIGRAPAVRRVDGRALERNRLEPPAGDAGDRTLVGCGRSADMEVQIVDPDTRERLPAGRIGEIWVRGTSVAGGYWHRPDETARVFGAVTADGEAGYLRTGDLGALERGERDDELFVTGRIKDLIIINGRNLYPHDLERESQAADPLLDTRLAVAFPVAAPEERVVLLQELAASRLPAAELAALVSAIKTALNREFGVRVSNVVLVRRGTIRKTTSGKLRRRAMRDLFLAGEIDPLYEDLDRGVRTLRERSALDAARALAGE